MARTYRFQVGAGEAGVRLDRFLTHHLPPSLSRAVIQRGIREGLVTVAGRPAKASYKLRERESVAACFEQLPAPPREAPLRPQQIPLEIVHEDADLLVVNKPPGLVTHPAPGHWDGTLVNAILWHLQQQSAQGKSGCLQPSAFSLEQPLARAGIVHRLDKDTSGLLLVAKTQAAHTSLSRQLKARTIHRRYVALVEGHVPLDTGTINAPIGRHLVHRKEMTIRHLGGRGAVTHYRVLHRSSRQEQLPSAFSLQPSALLYSVVDVRLETGRTHQIRVHLSHLGYPVLGDATYGKHPESFWQAFGITRHLLHAYAIQFQHPTTHTPLELRADPPDDIKRWVPPHSISDIKPRFDI